MTPRLKRHATTLLCLAKCDKTTARPIITKAKPELFHCLSDICHNILNGNIQLKISEKDRLGKYKKDIRKIADKKSTVKQKKILVQKGGFLGSLLAPLIGSVLGPLIKTILPSR